MYKTYSASFKRKSAYLSSHLQQALTVLGLRIRLIPHNVRACAQHVQSRSPAVLKKQRFKSIRDTFATLCVPMCANGRTNSQMYGHGVCEHDGCCVTGGEPISNQRHFPGLFWDLLKIKIKPCRFFFFFFYTTLHKDEKFADK